MNALRMKAIIAVVSSLTLGIAPPACAEPFDVETKLTASDGAADDYFGLSVAISGNTAIVGAWLHDDAGKDSGSAYLLDLTTGSQIKLTANDAAADDYFGRSVAISGNTAIVGAYGDNDAGSDSGSAYLFDLTTGSQLKLTANDAAADDRFGQSVRISGNTAIVGAYGDNDAGSDSGSAYLFDLTTGNQLKLTANDAAPGDRFGLSVGISGNTAIVGAYWDDDAGSDSGSAYLFDLITGSQLKLTASDAAAGDYFGVSVGISGNTAIVGATRNDDAGTDSGSAYLFDLTAGSQIKLTASDAAAGDWFGYSVGITGNTAIVGAYGDNDAGSDSGSAYLFDLITGSQIKLTANDAAADDRFGQSVRISGNTAIVGAYGDNDAGSDSGSAYLFDLTTGNQLKLTANDAAPGDRFGLSVGISGNTAIVGAYWDDDAGSDSGSAYLFDLITGSQLKLTASDAAAGDYFGVSVGISGNTAIVGATGNDDAGRDSGSAYVFVPEPSTLALLPIGALGLLAYGRRRKRR